MQKTNKNYTEVFRSKEVMAWEYIDRFIYHSLYKNDKIIGFYKDYEVDRIREDYYQEAILYILEVKIMTAIDLKVNLNRLAERVIYSLVGRRARLGTLQGERTYKQLKELSLEGGTELIDYMDTSPTPEEVLIENELKWELVNTIEFLYNKATDKQKIALDYILSEGRTEAGYLQVNDKQKFINLLKNSDFNLDLISQL